MNCEWEKDGDKFKCKTCGFVVPRDTLKRNCKQPAAPSMIQRGKNFMKAVGNHVRTGMQQCTDEQKQKRFEICKSNKCGLFLKRGDDGICAHDSCGCYIRSHGKFIDKLSWAESKCPEGHWNSHINA